MSVSDDDCGRRERRLASELEQIRALDARCLPELLLRPSRAAESTDGARKLESASDVRAAGAWVASRGLLAGDGEVDDLVSEIRQLLTATHHGHHTTKDRMLELWMIAERCLLPRELDELRPAVIKHLFGEDEAKISPSRDGRSLGGGSRPCP